MFVSNSKIEIHDYTGLTPNEHNRYIESEIKKNIITAFFEDKALIEKIKYSGSHFQKGLEGQVGQIDAQINILKTLPKPTKCIIKLIERNNVAIEEYYKVINITNYPMFITGCDAVLMKIEKPIYDVQ